MQATRRAAPLLKALGLKSWRLGLATLVALGPAAAPPAARAQVNLVQDGDFEQADPGAGPGSTDYFDNYVPGDPSTFDAYWKVTDGSAAIDTQDRYVDRGNKSLWVNPDPPDPNRPVNAVTQTLTTAPGGSYLLTFDADTDGPIPLTVTFGGSPVDGATITVPPNGFAGDTDPMGNPLPNAGVFTHFSFLVSALSASTDLTFSAPGSSGYPTDTLELDNVSVTAALASTPEPSSAAAFAFTGLGAAGLMLRARRRRGAA